MGDAELPRRGGATRAPRAPGAHTTTRVIRLIGAGVGVAVLLVVAWAWASSRLPSTYSATSMGTIDVGGGPAAALLPSSDGAHHHADLTGTGQVEGPSVIDFVADPARPADVHVELVARAERVELPGASGFDGYTLNGSSPGPTIRATQGQLVEVVLRNESVPGGATLHWHGVDVQNAMDGVAGVTQDALPPGESFAYRFVAEDAGTYWYHSHQVSHEQVVGGMFGALVVDPVAAGDGSEASGQPPPAEALALVHTYPGTGRTINGQTGVVTHDARPGDTVRVRVINTDNAPAVVWLPGATFQVAAIDGTDVNLPTDVVGQQVTLTAGARVDLAVRVPDTGAVRLQVPGASMTIGPPGSTAPDIESAPGVEVDLLAYGTPLPLAFDPAHPDRVFTYDIGRAPGFLDGMPGIWWTVNGRMGADVPMYHVREGDVVTMQVSNASGEGHPMHLHGHHFVVLEKNGVAATGSQWWVDSLDVANGETYLVALVADNPGIWMDHCHNLPHAAEGLMAHLMYEGVTTPFLLGEGSGNEPE